MDRSRSPGSDLALRYDIYHHHGDHDQAHPEYVHHRKDLVEEHESYDAGCDQFEHRQYRDHVRRQPPHAPHLCVVGYQGHHEHHQKYVRDGIRVHHHLPNAGQVGEWNCQQGCDEEHVEYDSGRGVSVVATDLASHEVEAEEQTR